MQDSDQRAREWLFDESQRQSVRGYLQATQGKALLALLSEQSRTGLRGSLAEIGVFFGKTLIGLARASRADEHVLGVDPLKLGQHDLTPELVANLKTYLTPDELARVTVRRAFSTDLDATEWMKLLKQPARFVHLDGHHARETILHDLQLASAWLQKGALVVFDDFLNELHPDLTSGILDGLQAHPQLEAVAVVPRMGHIEEGGSKLVCATRGSGAAYRDALDRALSDHLRPSADRMLGREVRVYRSSPPTQVQGGRPQDAQTRRLPVVFALQDRDGTYWANTAVAITSLLEHARTPLAVHVLHDETLPALARQRLARIAEHYATPLTLTAVRLPPAVDEQRLRQFGAASLFRLMIPNLFAEEPLVIYLDSDLVVNGLDIGDLARAVPASAAIAGVVDPNIAAPAEHAKALAALGLPPQSYVNSGVLALRPALLPKTLLEEFAAFSDAYPWAIHPDQDFLNVRFKGQTHLLEERFNYQMSVHRKALLKPISDFQGKILHYAGKIKPLDGTLAPGIIPFWVHAHLTPEISAGSLYAPKRYLAPDPANDQAFNLVPIG